MHLDDRERDAFGDIERQLARTDPRFRRRMAAAHDQLAASYTQGSLYLLYAVVLITGTVMVLGVSAGFGHPLLGVPGVLLLATVGLRFARWLLRPEGDAALVTRRLGNPPR